MTVRNEFNNSANQATVSNTDYLKASFAMMGADTRSGLDTATRENLNIVKAHAASNPSQGRDDYLSMFEGSPLKTGTSYKL